MYVTARQYGNLAAERTLGDATRLEKMCHDMLERYVIEHVLNPLANHRHEVSPGEFLICPRGFPDPVQLASGPLSRSTYHAD